METKKETLLRLMNSTVESLCNTINALSTEQAAQSSSTKSFYQLEIEGLQQQITSYQGMILDLDQEKKDLEQEIDDLNDLLSESEDEIDDLTDEVEELNSEIDRIYSLTEAQFRAEQKQRDFQI